MRLPDPPKVCLAARCGATAKTDRDPSLFPKASTGRPCFEDPQLGVARVLDAGTAAQTSPSTFLQCHGLSAQTPREQLVVALALELLE
jgi:hypothetical protein